MNARQLYQAVFNLSLSVQDLLDVLQREIQREEQTRRESPGSLRMSPKAAGTPPLSATGNPEAHHRSRALPLQSGVEDVAINPVDGVEEISVSLLSARTGQVPSESQINMTFSKHYNAGQAMIYLPKSCWHFFPDRNIPFTARTDDGERLTLKVVGTSARSLVTVNSYRVLNEYLRGRLGVPLDVRVTKEELERYGRTDIVFRKENGQYALDFSKRGP